MKFPPLKLGSAVTPEMLAVGHVPQVFGRVNQPAKFLPPL